ncbi:TetR family transcriptional regulator [Paenibacillus glycanilyticus]|uniref:TetR family transcriptional regulator n=1 Tax=Paenibacillus glycanilyticus TaxID=126569 RepID=A0ABQ6NYJ0_9BACL|nr:TetR/AcrR family transcriptional regulator [Paenibacillus glycanilyticus]GMK49064.1 TetR family transcriptional regulator [Paenibacillus glycanilyticus]
MHDKTNKKEDRRIIRSRIALREALLEIMTKKPFRSISITEIVEHANYNRGTFYSNYESKEALLDDIVNDLIHDLIKSFRAPYEDVEVFRINEIPAASVLIVEHVSRNTAIYSLLMKSDWLPELKTRMYTSLKKIAMEEIIYPDDGIDHELFTIYNLHAVLGLVFHWIESGYKHSPAYIQDQLIKLVSWRPSDAKISIKTMK